MRERTGWLCFALVVAALGSLLAGTVSRLGPPPPRPASAPEGEFSAARALAHLQVIASEPRPIGSPANARARGYLLGELRALGYSPAVQETFACGPFASCAQVRNVVARLDGQRAGRGVLLMAHYDSVAAGPGASDDGAGVAAVLEVARALRQGPPLPRPVILLIDDGEEEGLIGAAGFRAEHPWARDVGAVVNLEARGTSGPSLMFETGGDDGWLVRALAALPHPRVSSVFSAVYRLLPNDTDLSVFRPDGTPALNFAFIGDPLRYHTPLDDLSHASAASLQHHGENALAMVRVLARSDLDAPPRGQAVFFDLLGLGVVGWPTSWAIPLAVTALALLAAAVWIAHRRGRLAAGGIGWGLAAVLAATGVAGTLGLLLQTIWGAGWRGATTLPRAWIAHPAPALVALWATGLTLAWGAGALLWRRAGATGLWAGTGLGWAVVSLALALAAPAAAYPLTLPALVAGVAGLIWTLRGGSERGLSLAVLAAAGTAGVLLFPLLWLLYDALGLLAAPLLAALVALLALLVAPLVPGIGGRWRWVVPAVPAVAVLGGALLAATQPIASPQQPQPMAIAYREDAAGTAQWLISSLEPRLPEALRRLAAFGSEPVPPFAWAGGRRCFQAPARPLGQPPPELQLGPREEQGSRVRIHAHLASPRGAPDLLLAFPPGAPIEALWLGGHPVALPTPRLRRWFAGWQIYRCVAVPPSGLELEIVLRRPAAPIELEIVDQSRGLPPGGEALRSARGEAAVTAHGGDATYVSRRVSL